jgi:magnesium transporter
VQEFNLEQTIANLQELLANELIDEACSKFAEMHPAEIAGVLSAIPNKDRLSLWQGIDNPSKGDILVNLSDEVKSELIDNMQTPELVIAMEQMDTDDLADIVPLIPSSALHNLLLTLDTKHRENLRQVLAYDANSAGGLMNTDIITIRDSVDIRTVIRYLRLLGSLPKDSDKLFVVDRDYTYKGVVFINNLLSSEPETLIKSIILEDDIAPIDANTSVDEVVQLFERRDLISAPVIDEHNKVVGRITVDDVVDVIRAKAEESVKKSAGISDEELFSPILKSAKNRSIWLGINLITVLIAVFFIGLFAATMEQKIALAVLMPVVASMGGIAGTQSLILITRGIATGNVSKLNIKNLLNKEILLSIISGILWALVIGLITQIWFDDLILSFVIAIAIIVNIFTAALFGSLLPIILEKLKIDPALAGGVVLTTITDIVGFVAFLGLATIFFGL